MAAAVLMALPSNTAFVSNQQQAGVRQMTTPTLLFASPKVNSEPGFEFIPATQSSNSPVTPLPMLLEDKHEFELNLGRAVDTLKQDYPDILTEAPGELLTYVLG